MASPRADDDEVLEPALVDAITEVVVWSAGAAHRAEVLAAIIACVAEAVGGSSPVRVEDHAPRLCGSIDGEPHHPWSRCSAQAGW